MKKSIGAVRRVVAMLMAAVMTVTMIPGNSSVLAAEVSDTVVIDQDVGNDPAPPEDAITEVIVPGTEDTEVMADEPAEDNTELVTEDDEYSEAVTAEGDSVVEQESESSTEEEITDVMEPVTEAATSTVETSVVETSVEETVDDTPEDESNIVPSFRQAVSGVSTAGIDFSSKELLIKTGDESVFTWDTEVVSEYNGVYLTRYTTVEETKNAYTYYYSKVTSVSANITFRVSDDDNYVTEGADFSDLNEGDDALSNLNDMITPGTVPAKTIALIDTGVNADGLVDAVTVLGGVAYDDNGHGSKMFSAIKEEYPDAKVLSIKAMDANGSGQASNIYAAIMYAIEKKADLINLSLTANSSETNSVVVRAIEEAISKGITVVGAAGNNASDAKYYIPGCVKDAYIIGAADQKGDRLNDSNYGANVDYEVISNSTSEAAARFSALYMRGKAEGKEITEYTNVMINYDRTDLTEDDYVLLYDCDDFTVSRAAQSKTISITIGETVYKLSVPSYLVFPIYVNGTDTSKYYGFAGYRDASKAKAYLGSRTFNAAVGVQPTGGADEVTYSSITKNCGTYFNADNTVAGLPAGKFKDAYGSDATANGASDIAVYGSNPDYNTTKTGWTENWYNKGYRVVTSNTSDLYSFSVFCTEEHDMSPRGAYGQLIMLPVTSTNNRGYANYKVTTEGDTTYVWVPYRTDEVDQNAYSGHSNWQNFVGGTYLKVPVTKDYYIAIYKRNDSGEPMNNVTFDVKVNGAETKKAIKTGTSGIATYKIGTFTSAPTVQVQENWTNDRYEPKSTGYYDVTVYTTAADAEAHAKDANHTWTNERYEYYASLRKNGNKGITSEGFAGAFYGLYDTNVKEDMTDDHLIAVFKMDKDGYASELYGPTTSTVAGHTCKARFKYTEESGWKIERKFTVNDVEHSQYFLCMGKSDLTDQQMLTDTHFAYLELKAPDGYARSEDPIDATITKQVSIPKTLTSSQIVARTDEAWENNTTYATLIKKSANEACTKDNPNYSFLGAEYKVYKSQMDAQNASDNNDYSDAIATFTVKEDGTSNVVNMTSLMDQRNGKIVNTTFWVIESKAGKNYLRSTTPEFVVVKPTENYDESKAAVVTVYDDPVNDPFRIQVIKTDVLTGSNDLPDGKTLEGARFKIEYYAVDITTKHTASDLKTNHSAYKVDAYTKEITVSKQADGSFMAVLPAGITFPVGYITITETAPPKDYSLEGARAYLLNDETKDITGNLAFITSAEFNADQSDYDEVTCHPDYPDLNLADQVATTFNITVGNQPIRGNVEVNKADVVTGDPMEGVRFKIEQVDDNGNVIEIHYIYTDATGHATTVTNTYTNANYYDGPKDYDKTDATVWFGKKADGTMSDPNDGFAALPAGTYRITEEKTDANKDYQLCKPETFVIDKDHTMYTYQTYTDGKAYNVPKPEVTTRATAFLTNSEDGTILRSKMLPATKNQTIEDVVGYTNLKVDTLYTLVGRIMELKDDGTVEPFKQGDKEVVVVHPFTTEKAPDGAKTDLCANGEEPVLFENLDFTGLQDKTYVIYQTLYLGDVTEGNGVLTNYADANPNDDPIFPWIHEQPDNEDQQVTTPTGHTDAVDQTGTKTVTYTDTITLNDTLTYNGLHIGEEYTATAKLYLRPDNAKDDYTDEEIEAMALKDEDGNYVTGTVTFTATEENGSVVVPITFNANLLTSESVTIFIGETCKHKPSGIDVFTHLSVNDRNQTVYKPSISTTAMDVNDRRILAAEEEKFKDVIKYDNTSPNTEVHVVGYAMNKKTGKVLTLDGIEVTAEGYFTTGDANKENGAVSGTYTLEFEITKEMQKDLPGTDMVIYEWFYVQDKESGDWRECANHMDLSDDGQRLKVPTLKTTLLDKVTQTHVAFPNEELTFVDTCVYTGLISGKSYEMHGTLMNKDTKEPMRDKDGNLITATKPFVASETGDGVVELEFKFNSSILYKQGVSIVAFERCIPTGDKIPVCVHENIEDRDQEVDIMHVGTKAGLVKKSVTDTTATFEVTDQIMFRNLNTDYEFVAKGWLVDKDGNKVSINGVEMTAEKTFKPKTKDGSVDVTFPEFTCGKYDSFRYIVFEEVYVKVTNEDGKTELKLVGEHKDLTESNQTVTYKELPTPQTGDSTPIAVFLGIFVLALAGMGVIIWKKRKLNKED